MCSNLKHGMAFLFLAIRAALFHIWKYIVNGTFLIILLKKFFNKDINNDMNIEFTNYILEGGFPLTIKYDEVESKKVYVQSVINEIFEKDIKKNKKIRDKVLFNQIQTYIINNFGSTTSVDGIREYLKKVNGNRPGKNTIYNYLSVLENAKIISKCSRFDFKSKKSLNGEEK